jgi:XTP/dITP diphosphohydrolase
MTLDVSVPILVATKNRDKYEELRRLWGDTLPVLQPAGAQYPDVAEPHDSYEANALAKARALCALTGRPALADDSGLEVEALGGAPGVHSARTPSVEATAQERNAYVLRRLAALGDPPRGARLVCVCALLAAHAEPIIERGEVRGLIAEEARGPSGFGYDPIFVYEPYGRTFGELGVALKDGVSHRGNAVRALIKKARLAAARRLM